MVHFEGRQYAVPFRLVGRHVEMSGLAGKVEILVREELAAEKRRRKARTRAELEAVRESHDVLARDTLWGHDGTHLGRLPDGSEIAAEVIKDCSTLATVGLSVGGPLTAEANLALLKQCAEERGG
jgi:hypothetical protein